MTMMKVGNAYINLDTCLSLTVEEHGNDVVLIAQGAEDFAVTVWDTTVQEVHAAIAYEASHNSCYFDLEKSINLSRRMHGNN